MHIRQSSLNLFVFRHPPPPLWCVLFLSHAALDYCALPSSDAVCLALASITHELAQPRSAICRTVLLGAGAIRVASSSC